LGGFCSKGQLKITWQDLDDLVSNQMIKTYNLGGFCNQNKDLDGFNLAIERWKTYNLGGFYNKNMLKTMSQ